MCMCGCEYENGCGDCTINYNYCEIERLTRIKELKYDIEKLTEIANAAEEQGNPVKAAECRNWVDTLKDELRNLEEPEEEKEYRLEREEENRER